MHHDLLLKPEGHVDDTPHDSLPKRLLQNKATADDLAKLKVSMGSFKRFTGHPEPPPTNFVHAHPEQAEWLVQHFETNDWRRPRVKFSLDKEGNSHVISFF